MTQTRTEPITTRTAWWPTALLVTPALRGLIVRYSVAEGVRDSCPACDTRLGLGGPASGPWARCRCGIRLGPPPWTVELVAGIALLAVVLAPWSLGERLAYGWVLACWIVLGFVDGAVHRLPSKVSYAAAGGLLVLLAPVALAAGEPARLARAAAAGALVWLVLAGAALFGSTGLGGGDVRAGLSIGIAAGWVSWFAVLGAWFLGSTLLMLFGLVWVVARRRGTLRTPVALGPCLFLGTILAVLILTGAFRAG